MLIDLMILLSYTRYRKVNMKIQIADYEDYRNYKKTCIRKRLQVLSKKEAAKFTPESLAKRAGRSSYDSFGKERAELDRVEYNIAIK